MSRTKKITLSAMTVALGTLFLILGGYFGVLDLSACAIASVLVAFVYIEIGSPYTWLVWICTSLTAFILFPEGIIWLEYFAFFGIYPILKAYIERLRRPFWLPIKLVYANAVLVCAIFICELVFMTPFFVIDKLWAKAAIYAILNVAFVAYDIFVTVLVRFYLERLRHRFRHLLK